METTPSRKKRHSRQILTGFILGIVAACALLTVGVSSRIQETREKTRDWHAGYRCVEILRGDLIRVTDDGKTNLVQVLGMTCPPAERNANAESMAAAQGVPVAQLVKQGITCRKSLKTWIFKRRVNLEFPAEVPAESDDDILRAYVSVFGVDVARKMLQGGQAAVSDEEHPRREEFIAYEQEAQQAGLGLWHAGTQPQDVGRRLAVTGMIAAPLLVLFAGLRLRRRGRPA